MFVSILKDTRWKPRENYKHRKNVAQFDSFSVHLRIDFLEAPGFLEEYLIFDFTIFDF